MIITLHLRPKPELLGLVGPTPRRAGLTQCRRRDGADGAVWDGADGADADARNAAG